MIQGPRFTDDAKFAETIVALEQLARDLRNIRSGRAPTKQTLDAAPFMDGYVLQPYVSLCLSGQVTGHPHLGDSRIHTSELWAFDTERRWARTYSRWYSLGDSRRALPDDFDDGFCRKSPSQ